MAVMGHHVMSGIRHRTKAASAREFHRPANIASQPESALSSTPTGAEEALAAAALLGMQRPFWATISAMSRTFVGHLIEDLRRKPTIPLDPDVEFGALLTAPRV